jgi:hypothetical protein
MAIHRLFGVLAVAIVLFAAAPARAQQQVFWTLTAGAPAPPTATPYPIAGSVYYYYPCLNGRKRCRALRPQTKAKHIPTPVETRLVRPRGL